MKKEDYYKLADKIQENLVINDGNIEEKEKHSVYDSNLPEGVTPETVNKIAKYNAAFINASHIATARMAAELFKEDKNKNVVNASIGFFGPDDTVDITVHRSKTFTNSFAKEGEPKEVEKNLYMQSAVTVRSNSGIGLKSLKEELSNELSSLFKE
jgi:hypothetical protein